MNSAATDAQDVRRRHREYLVPAVSTYYAESVVVKEARGLRVTDLDGRTYLDFFGGILTVSVGHAHPRVADAIAEQARTFMHTSTLYPNAPIVDLAERLARITPGALRQSFFTTSGTEADETALLMAKLYTGRSEVVALRHSYSGRSTLAMSLTGQAPWRLGPTEVPGIRHAHAPYCYRCPFGKVAGKCNYECARDIEELIATTTHGEIAAFIAEPIMGVGGFITPPPQYFEIAVEIVRRHGGVFIADEVQTGFGRTGKPFGIENYGVEPELMTFAKGLANGAPIGATIAVPEVGAAMKGASISTFGGNPMSMRAALATLDVMEEENLTDNAAREGQRLRAGLEELQRRFPVLGDVRGMGLMQALEFVRAEKAPAPDLVLEFFEATKERGLLLGKGGLYGNVVRIAPPMTVSPAETDEALLIIAEALEALYRQHPELAA